MSRHATSPTSLDRQLHLQPSTAIVVFDLYTVMAQVFYFIIVILGLSIFCLGSSTIVIEFAYNVRALHAGPGQMDSGHGAQR